MAKDEDINNNQPTDEKRHWWEHWWDYGLECKKVNVEDNSKQGSELSTQKSANVPNFNNLKSKPNPNHIQIHKSKFSQIKVWFEGVIMILGQYIIQNRCTMDV